MLKFIFKPLKWFVQQEAALQTLILGILSLIGYGTFLILDYYFQIRPESLFGKLSREGLCLLLAVSAIGFFAFAATVAVKERRECWENAYSRRFWYQEICFFTSIAGFLGFGALAKVTWTVLHTFGWADMPLTDLWYALIPGAFFLAIALITFLIKVIIAVWKSSSDYISDQWRNA